MFNKKNLLDSVNMYTDVMQYTQSCIHMNDMSVGRHQLLEGKTVCDYSVKGKQIVVPQRSK